MILDILIESSKNVYNEIKDLLGTSEGASKISLGAGGDISRKIDIVAETAVLNTIKSNNISPVVIGEECGIVNLNNYNSNSSSNNNNNKGFVIMDAVDGTTNAIRGIPFSCCSLAFANEFKLSSVTDAVVLDLFTGDIYSASKQKGSFFNNKKISVRNEKDFSSIASLEDLKSIDVLIGTNVSGVPPHILDEISKVISFSSHIRHFGANALELCYFARGFMDAYIDIRGKIRSTDMAAAYLIAKEAGGKLYSSNGQELDSELGLKNKLSFYAVSNKRLFDLIKSSV
ncbi:MAG TPA: inositol monophosphatase family protein [Nitrososphaeraceae archaeon]|jgi:myo-inositol-1(or 4)-monophosphatase|nr:inositol monophosphatase family protein [Nitrososphaeraceae archaeon]HSL12901.1 inositol monophosphatase family protein [Nitrososphaeraceae archaeon]